MFSVFIINGHQKLEKLNEYDHHTKAIEGYLEMAFEGDDEENARPVLVYDDDQYYATIFLDRLKGPHDGIFTVNLRSGHSCSYAVKYRIVEGCYEGTEIKRL